jgi:hypothetical protein
VLALLLVAGSAAVPLVVHVEDSSAHVASFSTDVYATANGWAGWLCAVRGQDIIDHSGDGWRGTAYTKLSVGDYCFTSPDPSCCTAGDLLAIAEVYHGLNSNACSGSWTIAYNAQGDDYAMAQTPWTCGAPPTGAKLTRSSHCVDLYGSDPCGDYLSDIHPPL